MPLKKKIFSLTSRKASPCASSCRLRYRVSKLVQLFDLLHVRKGKINDKKVKKPYTSQMCRETPSLWLNKIGHIWRSHRYNQLFIFSCRLVMGFKFFRRSKITFLHRKGKPSLTLHCATVHAIQKSRC